MPVLLENQSRIPQPIPFAQPKGNPNRRASAPGVPFSPVVASKKHLSSKGSRGTMSAFANDRSLSTDTLTAGSSCEFILDRILAYPGTYELPLRTMYEVNRIPRAQPSRHPTPRRPSSISSNYTHLSRVDESAAQNATVQFNSSLMSQIAQLPQNYSLPPSFLNSFLQNTFPPDLELVDFPQALTGLDYLKDLESQRRRETANAMWKLGIERNALGIDNDEVSGRYPGVATWMRGIEEKERKVEMLYTQLYVSLRRWILINELSLLPFSKDNCIAMLNTLYPPVIAVQPTSRLTPVILKSQRDGFLRYIQGVQDGGPGILTNLMNQGRRAHDENGWRAVSEILDMYLKAANSIIDECAKINGRDHLLYKEFGRPNGAKVVSFTAHSRPSTSEGIVSKPSTPASPAVIAPGLAPRTTSRFKTLAREFKKLRSRNRAKPESSTASGGSSQQETAIRPSTSMGSLHGLGSLRYMRSRSTPSLTMGGNRTPLVAERFDLEELRKTRR